MRSAIHLRCLLFASACAAVAAGCGPPADRGLTRPTAVLATPFEQRDVLVQGIRLRYLDEGPYQAAEPAASGIRAR